MKILLAVAAGGALGAMARYGVYVAMARITSGGFPWSTVLVNVIGSFILGALITTMALKWSVSQEMRAFLTIGIMGAFTTFSTFSMEAILLAERGHWGLSGGYVLLSVVLSIVGFLAGLKLLRFVLV